MLDLKPYSSTSAASCRRCIQSLLIFSNTNHPPLCGKRQEMQETFSSCVRKRERERVEAGNQQTSGHIASEQRPLKPRLNYYWVAFFFPFKSANSPEGSFLVDSSLSLFGATCVKHSDAERRAASWRTALRLQLELNEQSEIINERCHCRVAGDDFLVVHARDDFAALHGTTPYTHSSPGTPINMPWLGGMQTGRGASVVS